MATTEGTVKSENMETNETDNMETEDGSEELPDFNKLDVSELKEELLKRNLNTFGQKAELIARLEEATAPLREKALAAEEAAKKAREYERSLGVDQEFLKRERMQDVHRRTILIYPVTMSDIHEDWLKQHFQTCIQFFVRFGDPLNMKCETGSVELRMGSAAEADAAARKLKANTKVHARRLSLLETTEEILAEIKGTDDPRSVIAKNLLRAEDLPENTTKEALHEAFPEADYIYFKTKTGTESELRSAYLEFFSEEKCRETFEKYKDQDVKIKDADIVLRSVYMGNENRVGMLEVPDKEDMRVKVRQLRRERQFLLARGELEEACKLSEEITELQRRLKRDTYLRKLETRIFKAQQMKAARAKKELNLQLRQVQESLQGKVSGQRDRRDQRGGRGGFRGRGGRGGGGRGGGGGGRGGFRGGRGGGGGYGQKRW